MAAGGSPLGLEHLLCCLGQSAVPGGSRGRLDQALSVATKKGRRDPSSGNYDERNDECLCSLDVNWDQVSFYARREGVPSHHYTVLAPPPPLARSSPLAPAGPQRTATAAPLPAC